MRCRHAPILDCGNYRSLYLLSCKVGAMISTGTEQKFTGVSKLRTRSSLVRSLQHCYLLYNTQHRKLVSLLASTRSVIKLSGWRQCCQTLCHQNLIGVTERGPGPASSDSIWSAAEARRSLREVWATHVTTLHQKYFIYLQVIVTSMNWEKFAKIRAPSSGLLIIVRFLFSL